jgi:hypothetical protein
LFHSKPLHKTPLESFFKHTIYGLRAAYKVLGMEGICFDPYQYGVHTTFSDACTSQRVYPIAALWFFEQQLEKGEVGGTAAKAGVQKFGSCNRL